MVPDYSVSVRVEPEFEAEVARVASAFGVTPDDILSRKHAKGARMALYYHLVENLGLSVSHTAGLLNVAASAVSMGVRRFKEKLKRDGELMKCMDKI